MCMDIGTGVDDDDDDDCHSVSVEKHCNNSYGVITIENGVFSSPFRYDIIRPNLSYQSNTSHGKIFDHYLSSPIEKIRIVVSVRSIAV